MQLLHIIARDSLDRLLAESASHIETPQVVVVTCRFWPVAGGSYKLTESPGGGRPGSPRPPLRFSLGHNVQPQRPIASDFIRFRPRPLHPPCLRPPPGHP